MWRHFLESSFGHVAATNILVDEDETVALEHWRGAETSRVLISAVRTDAVRGTNHKEGVGLGRVFRHIDSGEEPDAVAHRNAIFVLCVVRLDFRFAWSLRVGLRDGPARRRSR